MGRRPSIASPSAPASRIDADLLLAAARPGASPLAYGPAAVRAAEAAMAAWPGHAPTPLLRLGLLARSLGLGAVWYKNEAARFGVGSFKALGAAYALGTALGERLAGRPDAATLLAARRSEARAITATCATDGNLGRAIAWAATKLGCASRIYVHPGVSAGRRAAIASLGGEIVEVPGTYDDSVRRCAEDSARLGLLECSDTAYAGFERVPSLIMQGYTVLLAEVARQLPPGERISHIVVQAGVGGLAAATLDAAAGMVPLAAARGIVVEAREAACLFASAEAGGLRAVGGGLTTIMAGLACGVPSTLAWRLLRGRAAAYLRIGDADAVAAMRLLASGGGGEGGGPVIAGETGVAGLAGLLSLATDPRRRDVLGLGPDARVLLIGSEGASDPDLWHRHVGQRVPHRPART